ncbi:bacillithiol system redox-active protein YtxJ [Paenibacillus sepulcri]|uniref:Bacillithiol system redox-active protein YtxJ n=1 Tax=Paenibacillus sepulcri TaxID=359917 RepID=A0ABS7C7K2_9BACL|nr:bacillithiol system redox-active protein YtxJ [Paenibacillus sepulcri]
MERITSLNTVQQWNEVLSASRVKPLLVFKHSSRCSVSTGAYDELTAWLEDAGELSPPCFLVEVVDHQELSRAIAEQAGIKHESPQALLIENGMVSWHASHWGITYSTLDDHLGNHCEK